MKRAHEIFSGGNVDGRPAAYGRVDHGKEGGRTWTTATRACRLGQSCRSDDAAAKRYDDGVSKAPLLEHPGLDVTLRLARFGGLSGRDDVHWRGRSPEVPLERRDERLAPEPVHIHVGDDDDLPKAAPLLPAQLAHEEGHRVKHASADDEVVAFSRVLGEHGVAARRGGGRLRAREGTHRAHRVLYVYVS